MKIAVFGDVHGNLPALEVALKKINDESCDLIVCLGDIIGIGPFPKECLEIILNQNILCLMGNHEELLVHGIDSLKGNDLSEGEKLHQIWIHSQIDNSLKEKISKFPYYLTKILKGNTISFMHYPIDQKTKNFKKIIKKPNIEELEFLFGEINSDIIFYGHNHDCEDKVGKKRFISPGSLGCNTLESKARFIIINKGKDNLEIEKFSIPYDNKELFLELEIRNVPDRELIRKFFFH
ncbi:MAG: metallophosphoesterase [Bacteroidetes bacterium]|nr:metallophosphoesterase [Bacteroidota bacterium]